MYQIEYFSGFKFLLNLKVTFQLKMYIFTVLTKSGVATQKLRDWKILSMSFPCAFLTALYLAGARYSLLSNIISVAYGGYGSYLPY